MNPQITQDGALKPTATLTIEDQNFISIDDPNINWPPFKLSMLRTGRILLKNADQRHGVSVQQIGRTMARHYNRIGTVYRPMEIRELISNHGCHFTGGGIQVEAQAEESGTKRGPDYSFTFTKLYRPDPAQSMAQASNQVPQPPTNP